MTKQLMLSIGHLFLKRVRYHFCVLWCLAFSHCFYHQIIFLSLFPFKCIDHWNKVLLLLKIISEVLSLPEKRTLMQYKEAQIQFNVSYFYVIGEGNGNPLQSSCMEKIPWRNLVDPNPWCHKVSDTTEWLTHTHFYIMAKGDKNKLFKSNKFVSVI